MNRPWMPLYVADYLADTAHLNAAESGAYLHLIMHYWQNGGLPTDDRLLSRIAKMTPAQWKAARPLIAPFFHDGWKHKRVDFELAKVVDLSEAGRTAGKASGDARRKAAEARRLAQRSANDGANDPRTTDERSLNDQPNDQSTISQPLHSHSESERKNNPSLRSGRSPTSPADFDRFWARYPHKVGKQAAVKAFGKAMKSGATTLDGLMEALERYARKTDDRPWCNPATWLNEGRWEDQPAAGVSRNASNSGIAAADRLIEQFGGMDAAREYVPGSAGPAPLRLDFGISSPDPKRLPPR